MRKVDLDNLASKDLIDHTAISEAFKNYLMDVLEYDESEADFIVCVDFENPYNTPFIMQSYEGKYTVDGKDYEVRLCYTDFATCGLWRLAERSPFEFYMLFDLDTMPDTTVESYQASKKMYLI